MFNVFLMVRNLHEMLWYLTDSLIFTEDATIKNEIAELINETESMTNLNSNSILDIDIDKHRAKVNDVLKKVKLLVKEEIHSNCNLKKSNNIISGYDFIGSNLTKSNLIGANFAGALLIAANLKKKDLSGANLIGADMRDTDISGSDLSNSIFLTQAQVNSANGDSKTKLPPFIERPSYWVK